MVEQAITVLAVAAAIGSGVIGGVFYAFSTFVMAALARLPAARGVAAMQSINIVVINPWFLGAFFGTGAVCVAIVILALAAGLRGWVWLLAGSALYLGGTILVTMLGNVPRNNALARAAADGPDAARAWDHYVPGWTAWNHVRTACAIAASAAFIAALLAMRAA